MTQSTSKKMLDLSDVQQQLENLKALEELLPRRQNILDLLDDLNALVIPDSIDPDEGVGRLRDAIEKGEEKVRFHFGSLNLSPAVGRSTSKRTRKTGLAKKIKSLLDASPSKVLSKAIIVDKCKDDGFAPNSINSSLHSLAKKGEIYFDKTKKNYSL